MTSESLDASQSSTTKAHNSNTTIIDSSKRNIRTEGIDTDSTESLPNSSPKCKLINSDHLKNKLSGISSSTSSISSTAGTVTTSEYVNGSVSASNHVYTAKYCGILVHEMICQQVAVMRRQSDSYLNATQILKVAGIDKGRRSRIFDKDILVGEYEKVQGGYGKYQGTWIPYEKGVELAKAYNVYNLLKPLLELDVSPNNTTNSTPTVSSINQIPNTFGRGSPANGLLIHMSSSSTPYNEEHSYITNKDQTNSNSSFVPQSTRITTLAEPEEPLPGQSKFPSPLPPLNEETSKNFERSKAVLTKVWLEQQHSNASDSISDIIPESINLITPDIDIDVPIDNIGCTALHWSAILSKINLLKFFISQGASPLRGNNCGETPLMRAVLVTSSYELGTFPESLQYLFSSIPLADSFGRTVLHHIVLTSAVRGRSFAARYYLECLLEAVIRRADAKAADIALSQFVSDVVDVQDKNGDTALNIAARIGTKTIIQQLLEIGSSPTICNKAGLCPVDFGINPGPVVDQDNTSRSHYLNQPTMARSGQPALTNYQMSQPSQETFRSSAIMNNICTKIDIFASAFQNEMGLVRKRIEQKRRQCHDATKLLVALRQDFDAIKNLTEHLQGLNQKCVNLKRIINDIQGKTQNYKRTASDVVDSETNSKEATIKKSSLSAVQLKARVNAYRINQQYLNKEISNLQSKSSELENKCRKVIAVCCNIDPSMVDSILEGLLQAIESDGPADEADIERIASFLKAVKDQKVET